MKLKLIVSREEQLSQLFREQLAKWQRQHSPPPPPKAKRKAKRGAPEIAAFNKTTTAR